MYSFYAVIRENFLLLRRDRVLVPILIGVVIMFLISNFISEWSIDDPNIIYFNINQTILRISGGCMAILFAAKIVHDTSFSGNIETIIVRPVRRWVFQAGSYVSVVGCLLFYGVLAGLSWLGVSILFSMRLPAELVASGVLFAFFEWCILIALVYCLSSLCGFGMSIFFSGLMWFLGLVSGAMALSLEKLRSEYSDLLPIVNTVKKFWSFDRFNLLDYSRDMSTPNFDHIISCTGFTLSAVLTFLIISFLFFSSKDLVR